MNPSMDPGMYPGAVAKSFPRISPAQGVLSAVIPQVRQIFERLPAGSTGDAGDARFEHFTKHVWSRIKAGGGGGAPQSLRHTP